MLQRTSSLILGLSLVAFGCSGGGKAPAPAATPAAKPEAKPAAAAPAAKPAAAAPAAKPAAAPAAAPAAGKGNITGSVAFTGAAPAAVAQDRSSDPVCAATKGVDEAVIANANKTLKNVVVRVKGVAGEHEAPKEPAKIAQTGCAYIPHVQAVVVGQKISITNGDTTLHNVHTYQGTATLFNQAQPPGAPAIKKKLKKADPDVVKFKCDVHPWMTAYVAVHDSPHFAVTGDDGSFSIKGVPAGKYTVETWHESFGRKTAEVTVEADKDAAAAFSYDGTEKG